jgi:hypothetical protein
MLAAIFMTTRSLNILFSIVTLIFLSTCSSDKQESKMIEGDLYYSWLRIGSFYNQPDSIVEKVKLYADTVNRKLVDSSDLKTLTMYEILKKENLLYRPFIDLKLDNDSIVKIYFTNEDYNKINIFNRQELLNTKKKIRIKTEVRDLGLGMALCTNLLSVSKVDGQTLQINKKLKIEDYR